MKKVYEYRYENVDNEDIALIGIPEKYDPESWMAGYVCASEEAGTTVDCLIERPDMRCFQVHHEVDWGDGRLTPRMWHFYASSDEDLQRQLDEFGSADASIVKGILKVVPE